jgi:histidinol dehydrogenase
MSLAQEAETFADTEGLEAHGNTIRVRISRRGRKASGKNKSSQ